MAAALNPLYSGTQQQAQGPYWNAAAVTPSDSADLSVVAAELICSGSGVVVVNTLNGQTSVSIGITAGIPLRLFVTRVWSTNTTATGIVALW